MADSFYRRPLVSFVDGGDTVENRASGFDGDPPNSKTKISFVDSLDALAKLGNNAMESVSSGDLSPRRPPEVVSNNAPSTAVMEAGSHRKEDVVKVDGQSSLPGDGGEPKKNKNSSKNGNRVAYGGGVAVMEGSRLINNETELGAVVSKVWQNVKKIMGFSPECLHGGHKNLRGDCVCPKHFKGDLCETIVCLNNGTRERGPVPAFSYYVNSAEEFCRCPHPEFISGKHCEVLRCHNGGRDLGNGHCACVDGWYTGQFCQYYTSSWLLAVGLPLLSIAMVIICCVVCRLDLCPRRSATAAVRRDRRSRRYYVSSSSRQAIQPPLSGGGGDVQSFGGGGGGFPNSQSFTILDQEMAAREQARIIQENLLNEARSNHHFHHNYLHHHQYASSTNHTNIAAANQYVVRLEQIPTYNPRLFYDGGAGSGIEPTFKLEPPPSYDQAVLRCPSLNPPASIHPQPPDYSPASLSGVNGSETAQLAPLPPPNPQPSS